MNSKYQLGDIVWYLNPRGCPVSMGIHTITESKLGFRYNFDKYKENLLFPDKESAIQSVTKYKYRIGDRVWLTRGTEIVQMEITGYGSSFDTPGYWFGESTDIFCAEDELYDTPFGAIEKVRGFYEQQLKEIEDNYKQLRENLETRMQRLNEFEEAARKGQPLPKEEA